MLKKTICRASFFIRNKTNLKVFEKLRFKNDYIDMHKVRLLSGELADSYLKFGDYLEMAVKVNTVDALKYGRDRHYFYERCMDMTGRECLLTDCSSDDDLEKFILRNPKFVAKSNFELGGKGFKVYDASDYPSVRSMVKAVRRGRHDFLEAYITQHEDINKIYPGCVNTIRIHTVNRNGDVRLFFRPKLRIGCRGSAMDTPKWSGTLRALIEDDGSLAMPCYMTGDEYLVKCDRHPDTGMELSEVRIPYVKETIEMCLEAARRFPEMPFCGWDAAISDKGPVLVELNSISACFTTYQCMNILYNGAGLKKEILDMLKFAGL